MTQSQGAQEENKKVALRKRADARSLAERRAGLEAQIRDMALSDLAQVSSRLKALHKELERKDGREWTQQQLADKMGIAYRTFQSWESGEVENRDGTGYDKIARFYSRKLGRKITRQWIVFGEAEEPADLMGALGAAEPDLGKRLERRVAEQEEHLEDRIQSQEARLLAEISLVRTVQEEVLRKLEQLERGQEDERS